MSEKDSLTFSQVLADEYRVLRGSQSPASGEEPRPLVALCVSGGGIRSATFALGAIQGLAQEGVLAEFDYLSTVSGGGYIGGWLTCWKERLGGIDKIVPELSPLGSRPEPGNLDPIGHLREYNNYLSPRLGFFSADAWTLVATVIRNMALNWLVLVPLLMFALMAPRLVLSLGRLGETVVSFYGSRMAPVITDLSQVIPIASGLLLAICIFNTMRYLPGVGHKDHSEADFLKYVLLPLVGAALAYMTYDSWFYADEATDMGHSSIRPAYWQIVLWITGSCAAGWLGYIAFCVQGVKPRFRLLAGPLSLAILLTGFITATASWLLSEKIYPATNWSTYTTIGPPLLLLAFMAAGGLFVGLTSRVLEEEDREWLSRGRPGCCCLWFVGRVSAPWCWWLPDWLSS